MDVHEKLLLGMHHDVSDPTNGRRGYSKIHGYSVLLKNTTGKCSAWSSRSCFRNVLEEMSIWL